MSGVVLNIFTVVYKCMKQWTKLTMKLQIWRSGKLLNLHTGMLAFEQLCGMIIIADFAIILIFFLQHFYLMWMHAFCKCFPHHIL
jgi:hypothetical protein